MQSLEEAFVAMATELSLLEYASPHVKESYKELDDKLNEVGKQRLQCKPYGGCQRGALVRARRVAGWRIQSRGALKQLVRNWLIQHNDEYILIIVADSGKVVEVFLDGLAIRGAAGSSMAHQCY